VSNGIITRALLTLYSRFIRSTYTSRCNSPIPLMIVCPDSGSWDTLKVGSSFVNLFSALLSCPAESFAYIHIHKT
jgi:hypothetical protein